MIASKVYLGRINSFAASYWLERTKSIVCWESAIAETSAAISSSILIVLLKYKKYNLYFLKNKKYFVNFTKMDNSFIQFSIYNKAEIV